MEDVNLNSMFTKKTGYGVKNGCSVPTLGIEVDVAALALEANVIKKCFTLVTLMRGPYDKASLEDHELRAMVLEIRNIEVALGGEIKERSPNKIVNISVMRKSTVASKEITQSEIFANENIYCQKTSLGFLPMQIDIGIRTSVETDFNINEYVSL